MQFMYYIIYILFYVVYYTGRLVTGGTSGKGVILREKRSRGSTVRSVITRRDKVHAYRAKIQSRFSREQSLKRKIFILYFRFLFSCRITPFPLVPPITNHPVYLHIKLKFTFRFI